jgi:hypothetical protein
MKALKEAKKNERFWEFIKTGFQVLKDPSNDLPSLLITPVQRIPRYLMLVTQLLKYTWPEHQDYSNIKSAVAQLGTFAAYVFFFLFFFLFFFFFFFRYVDQKAKDAENVQKMHGVQEILLGKYDTLMDPQRRFVTQGLVFEARQKDVRLMCLFQFSDMVVWAKVKKVERKVEKKGDKRGKKEVVTEMEYHYQTRVPLLNCSLSGVEDQSKTIKNCFYLRTPEKNYLIATESPEAKRKWMANLNESIQQCNIKATTLRKQVAMVEEKKATLRQARASEERKNAPAPVSVQKPKRSGWLMKRKEDKVEKQEKRQAEADAAALSADADDTQSGDEEPDKKSKRASREARSLSGSATSGIRVDEKAQKGMFRGAATTRTTSKSTASDLGPSTVMVAPATEEKRRRLGMRLNRNKLKDKSSTVRPKSESNIAPIDVSEPADVGEETMNLSPSAKPLVFSGKRSDADDGERIRRGSRMLALDDLPTMDLMAGSGEEQMAELKAAFDRLGEATMVGGETPGRRRSLSAPNVLEVENVVTSPGPPKFYSSDEDEGESDSAGTPMKGNPKISTDDSGSVMSGIAVDPKRLQKLKALKRGSMSIMDMKNRSGISALSFDSPVASSGESSPAVRASGEQKAGEGEKAEGAKTPPRPRRTAPVLKEEGKVSEKAVLRKGSSVVVVEEDSSEEDEKSTSLLLGIVNNLHGTEKRDSFRKEEGDSESDDDDVGEPVDEPFSSGEVTRALASGEMTPQFPTFDGADSPGISSSGDVTPKEGMREPMPSAPRKSVDSEFYAGSVSPRTPSEQDDGNAEAKEVEKEALAALEEEEDESEEGKADLVSLKDVAQNLEGSFSVTAVPDNLLVDSSVESPSMERPPMTEDTTTEALTIDNSTEADALSADSGEESESASFVD